MGAGIGFSPASTRVAMVAARCRACSTRAPAPSTAGPTTLAPTVALALLFGEYMQRACHGRYDAKARNLRRSLRAAAAFADVVGGDEKPRLDGDFSDIGHRGAVAAWFAGGSWLGAAVGK